MSLAFDLQSLQERQRRELAFLRAGITGIVDTLEHETSPGQWIGEHPYAASAGAAMIGLVVAQFFGRSAPPLSEASASPPVPAAREPAQSTVQAEFMAHLMNRARELLQPRQVEAPACVTVGDAGAIAGPDFPHHVYPTAEGLATNSR